MSKSIKLKDSYYFDTKSIVHNKQLLSSILDNACIKKVETLSSAAGFDIVPKYIASNQRILFLVLGLLNGTTSGINAFILRLNYSDYEKIEIGSKSSTVSVSDGICHVNSRNWSEWLIISYDKFDIVQ